MRDKVSRPLKAALATAALQKRNAGIARRAITVGAESPRAAILDGCRIIGETLGPLGYQFRSTSPVFVRRDGDLIFKVEFRGDRNNASGYRAAVWIIASVGSRRLQQWRRRQVLPPYRRLRNGVPDFARFHLGRAPSPIGLAQQWDFALASDRESVAAEALRVLSAETVEFYCAVESCWATGNIFPLMTKLRPIDAIELSYAFHGKEAAEDVGRGLVDDLGAKRAEFEKWTREYCANGLPNMWGTGDPIQHFAADALALELDLIGLKPEASNR